MRVGCHLSVGKGYAHMGKRILELGGNTFQYFSRNPRGGAVRAFDEEDARALDLLMKEKGLGPILTHAPYTLNLASPREETREFARKVIREDLERLELLPGHLYNIHPGSHTGIGPEAGMEGIIKGLKEAVPPGCTSMILFEVMAGKGSEIGRDFAEIAWLLEHVPDPEGYGVCLDTCHLWEGGYDILHNLEGVLEEADRAFGLDRVRAIHLNDSKNPLGARKDRHEKLGLGALGWKGIRGIISHPRLRDKPFFLETPNEEDGYALEIAALKEMMEG